MNKSNSEFKKGGRGNANSNRGGRGYCGSYITFFGKEIYLRSMQEFILAKYLDKYKIPFLTEVTTFCIDGINYKPDFFIYEKDFEKLKKITEIKYTNKEKQEYLEFYGPYFKKVGITYEVLSLYDIKTYYKKEVEEKDIEEWKDNYIKNYSNLDYSGLKNPMYGIRHTDATKKKIGEQTRKYMQNEEIKQKQKIGLEIFWKSERGKEVKKLISENTKKHMAEKNPIITRICKICNKEYEVKTKSKYHHDTCSNSCSQKYSWMMGKSKYRGQSKKSYKTRLMSYYKILVETKGIPTPDNYNNFIKECKDKQLIPLFFGMNLKVVIKYFESLENLHKEFLAWEN